MARLVLGPLVRYVGEARRPVWVETDAACEVKVLDKTVKTFEVAGHHYAIVCIDGSSPARRTSTRSSSTVSAPGPRRAPSSRRA